MPTYRSHTTTKGRNMAGARSLWRATGMKDGDFEKPIIGPFKHPKPARKKKSYELGRCRTLKKKNTNNT